MKKIKYLIVCFFIIFTVNQAAAKVAPPAGTIVYDMNIALRKQVAKQNAMLASFVPEEQHLIITVTYNNENYVVEQKNAPADGKPTKVKAAIAEVMTAATTGRELVSTKTGIVRGEHVLRNRNFYTETPLKPLTGITYTNESKVILGYTCNKAVIKGTDGKQRIVWYTREFEQVYLPELELAGIKGTVLECTGDFYTIRATSVSNKLDANALVPRSPAKKITEEQLQDLQDEQLEEVQKNALKHAGSGRQQQTTTIIVK